MRNISTLLAATLLLGGCEDAIGFGSNCSAQMREVRLQERGPPTDSNGTEQGGNFVEVWRYGNGASQRIYTFRWGVSRATCEVSRPMSLSEFFEAGA